MFNNMNHIPVFLISSNDDHKPNAEEIIEMVGKEGYKDIQLFSKKHSYIQQNRGWKPHDGPKTVNEHLILARK